MHQKTKSKKITHALSLLHFRESYKKPEKPTFWVQPTHHYSQATFSYAVFYWGRSQARLRSMCLLSDSRLLFLFLSSLLRSPVPSVAIFKMQAGKRSGWRVDMGQGGTGEEMGNRWVEKEWSLGPVEGSCCQKGGWGVGMFGGFITYYMNVWACFPFLSALALVGGAASTTDYFLWFQ